MRPLPSVDADEAWVAHDEVLDRPVAVRVRHDGSVPERTGARVSHPNLVATFDTVDEGGSVAVVSELVEGDTLDEVVARHGPLPPARAVDIGVALTDALAVAHAAGVAHGDLTARRVVVSPEGRVKLAGLASGAAGAPADDVAALGRVLYHALAGAPAPVGDAVALRRVRAGIPRPLDEAIRRAVEGTLPSMGALRTALLAVDLGRDDAQPLLDPDTTPPHGGPPVARPPRRGRLVPVVVAAVLAVMVGTVAIALVAGNDGGDPLAPERGGGAAEGAPVAVQSVSLFDPAGDGDEHNDEVAAVVDGDPSTTWSSHTYRGPAFGGLKPGVGLVLTLARAAPVERVRITSAGGGWEADVHVAERAAAALAGWGAPEAAARGTAGAASAELEGRSGSVVLVWFTETGPGGRLEIAEIAVA